MQQPHTFERFASVVEARLSNMTSRQKLILGSALVLAFLFIAVLASAIKQNEQGNLELPASIDTNASVDAKDVSNNVLPEAVEEGAGVETKVEVKSSSTVDGANTNPQVQLEVNGQQIEVPTNGGVTETITNEDGDSTVEVNVHTNLTEKDHDRTRIRINSETESEVRIRN